MKDDKLVRNVFGSSDPERKSLLNDEEIQLASLVYNVAYDEIYSNSEFSDCDTNSVLSSAEKAEAIKSNLNHVVDLFWKTNKAKRTFMRNFGAWKIVREANIKRLKEIAEEIQTDRFKGNISKIVGGCVGVAGGAAAGAALLCPPLSPVTVPLAIAGGVASFLGGGVVVGTTGTEIVLLKKKMEEAKNLIQEEKERFSSMQQWFTHSEELLDAVEAIVGFDVMEIMFEEVQKFFSEVKDMEDFRSGKYNDKFRALMKSCVEKMCESSNITAIFGAEMAPVVMSFIFVVCLLNRRNRIILDCVIVTKRLAAGFLSVMDVGVETGRVVAGLAMKGSTSVGKIIPAATARVITLGVFIALGVAIDILNIAIASREIHVNVIGRHALQIRKAAEQLEEEFLFLQSVYNEFNLNTSIKTSVKKVV